MKRSLRHFKPFSRGFTLIEMVVIAPIVILLIGGFISVIVNMTGDVMSSRGSNTLTYNVQDALNRIEQDVKLSTTYLAVNNIDVSTTKQGYGGTTTTGSTVNFTNIDKTSTGGSPASIILNTLVTNSNPISTSSGGVYLNNQPNNCSAGYAEYSKNTPMTANIVYFVDSSNTLWRRVIMPSNYATAGVACGTPWQIPSCIYGYSSGSLPFCKTNDERLADGVAPSDFTFQYFVSASSTTPSASTTDTSLSDAARNTALLSTPTIGVNITARQTIAGRDISRSASLRATRLDANASSIGQVAAVTVAPAAPLPTATISNGHIVTVTWPQVATATSYEASYRLNGGAWSASTAGITNNSRSYVVSAGNHTDAVDIQVRATNSAGSSSYTMTSITIPLWAPLNLNNGWTDYGSGYATAAYTRTKAGYVILKGLIKKTSFGATSGEIIATLPPDYRPNAALMWGNNTNNTAGRVDIWNNGQVIFSVGSTAWFALDSIRFLSSTAGYTQTPVTLQNGWVNYAPSSWAPATYAQDSTGRVNLQGLIANGTMTDNTPLFSLPASLAPSLYMHIATTASNAFSLIGVNTGPSVVAKGVGSNGYYSITASYIPGSASVTWNNMTLQSGWVAFGGAYSTPQFTKTSDGVVHLKGLITGGTNADGTLLVTLPAGYRPKEHLLLSTVDYAQRARLDVNADGTVLIYYSASNGWMSFDGLSFVAEQ